MQKLIGNFGLPLTVMIDKDKKVRYFSSTFPTVNEEIAIFIEGLENAIMDLLDIDPGDTAQ